MVQIDKKHFKHGLFFELKSKVKICPSNLLIAPTINIFLNFNEYLFNKNFVLKLSLPSTIYVVFINNIN